MVYFHKLIQNPFPDFLYWEQPFEFGLAKLKLARHMTN